MTKKNAQTEKQKAIATWLPMEMYGQFLLLAKANNVSVAAYLRALVVDAVADSTRV